MKENPLTEKYSELDEYDIVKEKMQEIARKELSSEILKDLKRRNKSWYRIIYGIYIEDRSTEEIAESLGISVKMLYSKMYRAKSYIKERYGDQYIEYFNYFKEE